jgi:hypothetical protein
MDFGSRSFHVKEDPTSRETVEKVINGSFQTLSMINATVSQQETFEDSSMCDV